MDRLLRPKVFETETTSPNSEKLYRHWKTTFENYLETSIPPVDPAADDAADRQATIERKKMFALVNKNVQNITDLFRYVLQNYQSLFLNHF